MELVHAVGEKSRGKHDQQSSGYDKEVAEVETARAAIEGDATRDRGDQAEQTADGLLRYSIAQSAKEKVPFVVTFATPAYCQSRTCGPAVDVVEAVRKRFEAKGVRFIHVEIYKDNLPGNGVNRCVTEWKLPTEPWVFVIDRNGVVRDRFEGAISVAELEQSVRKNLLS